MDDGDRQLSQAGAAETFFAPAARSSAAAVAAQVAQVVDHPVVRTLLECFGGYVLVLNQQRQILAASPELADVLAADGVGRFVGMRPGEALGCEHSVSAPNGCGTSQACRHCGAVMAILMAQCAAGPTREECWMSIRRNRKRTSVEFAVKASTVRVGDQEVVVLALHDISDEKRRLVLESSFLHDLRNVAMCLTTWTDVLKSDRSYDTCDALGPLVRQLRDLLNQHATLVQAERGELVIKKTVIAMEVLADVLRERFASHPDSEGKTLVVRFPEPPLPVCTDESILIGILSNMMVNALEATTAGDTVEIALTLVAGAPTFSVKNPGAIPEDVASRIFQRSFSTKSAPGHGLGTYCMRLLGEQYLGGTVSFTSSDADGTVFRLALPAS
jgi:signal transduction histidine kinase